MQNKPFNYYAVALALMITVLIGLIAMLVNCFLEKEPEATIEYVTFSEQIQAKLVDEGYLQESDIDGKIGPKTREAIKRYDERLKCDQYAVAVFAKQGE